MKQSSRKSFPADLRATGRFTSAHVIAKGKVVAISEFNLDSSTTKKDASDSSRDEVTDPADSEPLSRPFQALLRFRALAALQHREFRLLWYGQIFSSMATWMDSIARGWLVYELTNSSFQLGLVRGVQAIPTLLLSPIAGSAADLY